MYRYLIAILLIYICPAAMATVGREKVDTPVVVDTLPKLSLKDQKRKERKERNTTEFTATLLLSQSQFDNWASGGDNTFTGRSTIHFRHLYKKDKFSIENRFNGRYGISVIDSLPYKNEDEFTYNMQSKWAINDNWFYAGVVNLRSQFSKGYISRTNKTLKSNFMAPGFLDVSLGFNFKPKKSPISITFAPATGNIVFVLDDDLTHLGLNGVEKGKSTKGQLGSSLRVEFDKTFAKNMIRYRSNIFSFSNFLTTPTFRFENTLEIRPVKFLTTTLFGLVYYDQTANTPRRSKWQLNYSISIGVAYTFKNK